MPGRWAPDRTSGHRKTRRIVKPSRGRGMRPMEVVMRMFDVQAIEIRASRGKIFDFVSDPLNLPRWAQAFRAADHEKAQLETPLRTVDIGLRTDANPAAGTVDWRLEFP